MKNKFFEQLRDKLSILSRGEAAKCIQQYEELYADKLEQGCDEGKIIDEFGDMQEIRTQIVELYEEKSNFQNLKYVNPKYIILDFLVLLTAGAISAFIYRNGNKTVYLGQNMLMQLGATFLFLLYNYACGVYRVKSQQDWKYMFVRLFKAVVFEVITLCFFLYIFRMFRVSRVLLLFYIVWFVLVKMIGCIIADYAGKK